MISKDKKELSKFGAEIDENGNISNYNQIKTKYLQTMANSDKDSEEYKDAEW